MATNLTYTDRFGHEWRVRGTRSDGGWSFVFVTNGIRLVAEGVVETPPARLGDAELKELFCDAERTITTDGETWYVGYRRRPSSGRGNMQGGGLVTRFRSDTGEIRYSREMLDFRHMSADALREHLDTARGTAGKPGR